MQMDKLSRGNGIPPSHTFLRGKCFSRASLLIFFAVIFFVIIYHPDIYRVTKLAISENVCETFHNEMYPLTWKKLDFLQRAEEIFQKSKQKRLPYFQLPMRNVWYDPVIWDILFPSFNCPFIKERVGRIGDGGKWVCGIQEIAEISENRPCIVYSFGVAGESSFEKDILDRTNCTVFGFDPTVNAMALNVKDYEGRLFFEKLGIAGGNNKPGYSSLGSIMKRLGHTWIDMLKVDVEGAEFAAFDNVLQEFPTQLPFGNLNVEIHLTNLDGKEDEVKEYFHDIKQFSRWFESLEERGLRPFHRELNPLVVLQVTRYKPICAEYSFFNIYPYNHCL